MNNNSKRVLLFTRPIALPWDEGSKNLAWQIAKNSNDDDLNFSVLTPKNNLDFLENCKNIQPEKIYSSEKFGFLEKIRLLKYFSGLKRGSFDVIHFLFTPRSLTSNLINHKLKKLNCRTIQTIATLNQEDYENPKKLEKILFANKIVAQSDYTFKRLQSAGFNNVDLIYPGIDLSHYQPKEKNVELQKSLGINTGDFVMLYAGEFTRLDAIDDLIETAHSLLTTHYLLKYKLIIACRIKNQADATKKKAIEAKIKKLNLEKNIIVLQKTVGLLDYYNLSDLSIFPAQKMAGKFDIPLVLAESMACGKPVLSSDLPVLKEFIKEDETGFISPKGDPKKLAEKIAEIISQPEKLRTISQNALNYAKENFDIQKNAKKYEEVYKSL